MTTTPTQAETADYLAEAGRLAWEVPGITADIQRRPVERVGVIGAGTMGGGISMNFLTAGIPVTMGVFRRTRSISAWGC